jgi:hypothetical protein
MIRYSLFVLTVLSASAIGIAALQPVQALTPPTNVTVIAKNQAFPVFGPLVFEDCATEDCAAEE